MSATTLSSEIVDEVEEARLVDLFEAALQERATAPALLAEVVAAVAEEGEIHLGGLRPVFAAAVVAELGWVEERVNAPFAYTSTTLPDRVRQDYLATHDFLREVMRDRRAADDLRRAIDDYGATEVAGAPPSGDARVIRLARLGTLQSFVNEARRNAERGEAISSGDAEALEAADAANRDRKHEDAVTRAVWVATALYGSATPEGQAVRERATGQSFIDEDGALKADMSPEEREAFRRWASSLAADGGITSPDVFRIDGGAAAVISPTHGVLIEDRR